MFIQNHCSHTRKKPCRKEKKKQAQERLLRRPKAGSRFVMSPVNICVMCLKVQEGVGAAWQNGSVAAALSARIEQAGLRFNYVACPNCFRHCRKDPLAIIERRVALMRTHGDKVVAMTQLFV